MFPRTRTNRKLWRQVMNSRCARKDTVRNYLVYNHFNYRYTHMIRGISKPQHPAFSILYAGQSTVETAIIFQCISKIIDILHPNRTLVYTDQLNQLYSAINLYYVQTTTTIAITKAHRSQRYCNSTVWTFQLNYTSIYYIYRTFANRIQQN